MFSYLVLIQKAAEERKNQILEIDQSQNENPELTEMQQDAQKRSKRILSRAYDLQMEEEQEIKSLNKVGSRRLIIDVKSSIK